MRRVVGRLRDAGQQLEGLLAPVVGDQGLGQGLGDLGVGRVELQGQAQRRRCRPRPAARPPRPPRRSGRRPSTKAATASRPWAPTKLSITAPLRMPNTAGMPCTLNAAEICGFSSTLTLASTTWPSVSVDHVLDDRTELAARAAPRGPQVDHDRHVLGALDDLGLERGVGDVDHRALLGGGDVPNLPGGASGHDGRHRGGGPLARRARRRALPRRRASTSVPQKQRSWIRRSPASVQEKATSRRMPEQHAGPAGGAVGSEHGGASRRARSVTIPSCVRRVARSRPMGHDWPVDAQANSRANARITAAALAGLLAGWAGPTPPRHPGPAAGPRPPRARRPASWATARASRRSGAWPPRSR